MKRQSRKQRAEQDRLTVSRVDAIMRDPFTPKKVKREAASLARKLYDESNAFHPEGDPDHVAVICRAGSPRSTRSASLTTSTPRRRRYATGWQHSPKRTSRKSSASRAAASKSTTPRSRATKPARRASMRTGPPSSLTKALTT